VPPIRTRVRGPAESAPPRAGATNVVDGDGFFILLHNGRGAPLPSGNLTPEQTSVVNGFLRGLSAAPSLLPPAALDAALKTGTSFDTRAAGSLPVDSGTGTKLPAQIALGKDCIPLPPYANRLPCRPTPIASSSGRQARTPPSWQPP